jgi:glutathione synthase/RimK-type ligase-like ATP-grasp enzyme
VRAVRPVRATPSVQSVLSAASAALGLVFAAVDLEEEGGAGGEPWVLDVNPGPMFADFERGSGLDVAGPLADCLLQRARLAGEGRCAASAEAGQ